MLEFPQLHPVAFQLGPLKVHWYGLMYLLGFGAAWLLANRRIHDAQSPLTMIEFADLFFYAMLGVVIGGRLGHMIFYDSRTFLLHPIESFKIWQGGMSFHGGLIGVAIACWIFSRRLSIRVLKLTDFIAPLVPIPLGLGRFGNFINGELYGRYSDLPWAMHFPHGGPFARHPSQLYELLLEGLLLFVLMWVYSAKARPLGRVTGLFLFTYALMRFGVEFVREPDSSIGFLAFGWVTMGQLLCLPMLLVGLLLMFRRTVLNQS